MKVVFLSGSMQGGGAERVVSLLANQFIKLGFSVVIIVVRGGSVYDLDNKVKLVPVYEEHEIKVNGFNKIFRRFNFYPRLLARVKSERPDVLIPVHGGGWNGSIVLIAKILGIKVIAAEHINYTVGRFNLKRWFERGVIYKVADAVPVLTKFDFDYYKTFLSNVRIIQNPIGFRPVLEIGDRKKVILSAGRLNSWSHKGFDNLLKTFSIVSKKHEDWRLQIAGAGDEGKTYLTNLASQLQIADKVDFLGFQKEIDQVMRGASIFVLSSRFEGFGMVLAEAMSQGCACISFDCLSGPAEIITNGVDGILVEDQNNDAMARELDRLMSHDLLRNQLATSGLKKAENFSIKAITQKWIGLFRELGLIA